MTDAFTFDKLREAMLRMPKAPMYDRVFLGYERSRMFDPIPYGIAPPSYAGIQVHKNPMFPYTQPCTKCGGTGDGGEESTYCERCAGQGASRIEGVMTQPENNGMVVLTSPLPKKFAVRWPASIPVPKRQHPGIRSVRP